MGQWCPAAGKVTVGLASHWPCVTDFSLRNGDEHPAYTPRGVWHSFTFTFSTLTISLNIALSYPISYHNPSISNRPGRMMFGIFLKKGQNVRVRLISGQGKSTHNFFALCCRQTETGRQTAIKTEPLPRVAEVTICCSTVLRSQRPHRCYFLWTRLRISTAGISMHTQIPAHGRYQQSHTDRQNTDRRKNRPHLCFA